MNDKRKEFYRTLQLMANNIENEELSTYEKIILNFYLLLDSQRTLREDLKMFIELAKMCNKNDFWPTGKNKKEVKKVTISK